jgi:hypothetical protein
MGLRESPTSRIAALARLARTCLGTHMSGASMRILEGLFAFAALATAILIGGGR